MNETQGVQIHPDVASVLHDIGALFELSTISREDVVGYLTCIKDAVIIHVDREQVRHGLWKDYDGDDQVRQIFIKSDRVRKMYEVAVKQDRPLTQAETNAIGEECDDIINYATFTKRSL